MNGGYEDWAYGASWDVNNVPKYCNIENNIKIPINYPSQTNRALTYLIEAGEKLPPLNTGGNELDVINPGSP